MTPLYRERRANKLARVFSALRATRCALPNAVFNIGHHVECGDG